MKCLAPISLISLLLFAPAALANVEGVTNVECEGKRWTESQVLGASEESLQHLSDGTTVGDNDYPHQFNNREGFEFNDGCNAPFYTFPIVNGGEYDGGPPNTDRVVLGTITKESAIFCGAITHTNAGGNGFNACDGGSGGNKTRLIGRRIMRRGARASKVILPGI